jgi:addiction module HigA family antidote
MSGERVGAHSLLHQLDHIMVRIPTHRAPTHPGEILLEEFLKPLAITQVQLAEAIEVSLPRVNEIVKGHRGVTPSTALRLAKFFDTTPDFWLNLQQGWDLYEAMHEQHEIVALAHIHPRRGGRDIDPEMLPGSVRGAHAGDASTPARRAASSRRR